MAQYELLKDSCVGAHQMVSRRRLKRGELSLCYPNKHRLSNIMEMQKDKSMTRGGKVKDACKKKREQHDASQAPVGMNYPGAYGVAPPVWQIPFMGAKPVIPEVLAVPNNILFVQNLPLEATPLMLSVLFRQYPGFKAVCMVEAKSGIAFVEYENELLSTFAMNALQNFKIVGDNAMLITYAKK